LVAVFYLSGYRYLGDGGTDQPEILHDGTYRSQTDILPFWERYPQGTPKSEILGLHFGHNDGEYLENGKSQRCMSTGA